MFCSNWIDEITGNRRSNVCIYQQDPNSRTYRIPLPPSRSAAKLVAEIEGYQKVIDGARAVVENYRPHIAIDPEWPMVAIGEHFTIRGGGTPSKGKAEFWEGEVPWISPKDMKEDFLTDTEDHISELAITSSTTKLIPAGSITCVVRSGVLAHSLPVAFLVRDMCINQDLVALTPKSSALLPRFLFYLIKSQASSILQEGVKSGVTVQSMQNGFFSTYRVPMPSLAIQQTVVNEIEAERAIVDANRELIQRFDKKIQDVIARVWEEDNSVAAGV